MVNGRVSVTHMAIARWATGAAWHLSASGPCPLVGCSAGRLLAEPGQRHSSAETRDDTNPRPPPAAPSPTSSTWGVCWTMSASGLPCWSVTDTAGGLEDAVACCNPSKLSLSLSAVERVAAMAERPWPPPCGDQSSPCAQLVRKLPYVSETKVRRPGL